MGKIIDFFIRIITNIHNWVLSWNDRGAIDLTDKQLHFLVIGIVGMALLFVIFPLFKALSKKHILIVAWIYVFTVIVVLTFAIEIGQGISGTGSMEIADITAGLSGFMVMFLAFAVLRWIWLTVRKMLRERKTD